MLPDIDRVTALIREVAESEILPRFRHLAAEDVREKGPGDLVTVADEAAERELTRRLCDIVPGALVIGEEAVAADRSILDRLRGAAPVWIIDPIDGTLNFTHGQPTFAVIVAYVEKGETLAGWIHDPCDRRTATAVKGEGAWLDGSRRRVTPPAPPSAMHGALYTRVFAEPDRRRLEQRAGRLGNAITPLGCAAHEYLRLLDGAAHFALYHQLMPWDHAAGTLMHAEAGGWHAKLDGSRYAPTELTGGLLLAPDAESWHALHSLLFGEEG